jgi:TPR repeat protein
MIEMQSKTARSNPWVAAVLCLFAGSLWAGSAELDQALEKYYAGYPREAINMIEPLAVSGDVEAQYLLGNLFYTLNQSGRSEVRGDPAKWYRLAAAQGSARAAYALGAIYHNRWLQARRDEDLHQAESCYRQALDLGNEKARAALDKLALHKNTHGKTTSLTYTNASFDSRPQSQPLAQPAPKQAQQTATLAKVLQNLQGIDDSDIDKQKLEALLGQLNGAGQGDEDGAATTMLRQMLSGFETTDQLFSNLLQLIGHLEAASELGTAPGSN